MGLSRSTFCTETTYHSENNDLIESIELLLKLVSNTSNTHLGFIRYLTIESINIQSLADKGWSITIKDKKLLYPTEVTLDDE